MSQLQFPNEFIFGAATAAYQIEGAVNVDGRGKSIWDTFAHKAGKIANNHNGNTACEHYYRVNNDINLMRQLRLDAYRLSISWPRIFPEGTGKVNQQGLDFYKRLLDSLLAANIDPYVTLFHWDMPQALDNAYGGFLSRQSAYDFADYCEVVCKALGDRVNHWITLNEPFEHGCFGYVMGIHAPGKKRPWSYLKVMHHQLLAHGLGVERIRSVCPKAKIGLAVSLTPIHPQSPNKNDIRAARTANEFINFITLDPLFKGHYPKGLWQRLRYFRPTIEPQDWQTIQSSIDFIGVNNYQREFAKHSRFVPFLNCNVLKRTKQSEHTLDGVQYTAMGWEVYPPSINEALTWLRDDYGNPTVYITENGAAFEDVCANGEVNDTKRISYLKKYMQQVKAALDCGSNISGYFVWSLLDNFEWAEGYDKRFGLIHIDYQNQRRTIKNSGYWYKELIDRHRN